MTWASTPEWSIKISRWLSDVTGGDAVKPGLFDVNPDNIEHIFNALTGGPGRTAQQFIDLATSEKRASLNKIPFVNIFAGEVDDKMLREPFYDLIDEVTKARNWIHGYQQEHDRAGVERGKATPEGKMVRYLDRWEDLKRNKRVTDAEKARFMGQFLKKYEVLQKQ